MKIIQIVTQMEAGGAQRVSCLLREGLSDRGHVSKVWFLYVKRRVFAENAALESLIRQRPSFLDYLCLAPKLAWKIIAARPDAVITHTHYANVLGQLVAFLCGVNVRIAVHHNAVDTYPRVARALDAMFGSLGIYSRNVLVSPSLESSLVGYSDAYRAKTIVVRNGVVDIPQRSDPPDIRERFGIPQGAAILVHVGRLSKQKNQEFISRLIPELPEAHLLLVGEGELRSHLEQLSADLGISERVHFAGELNIDDVYSILRCADIFVFPSLFEAMPLAMIDAMMCGLPIIASDIPSAHELLEDSGIISDVSDKMAWLEAINRLICHAGLRTSLAQKARERALLLTLDEMTTRYESLMFEVAGVQDYVAEGEYV